MWRSNKRSKGRRIGVDLFPFLGIIVCVIGVLVLLISGLAAAGGIQEQAITARERLLAQLTQLEGDIKPQSALVQRIQVADEQARADRLRLADAERQIAAARAAIAELEKARKNSANVQAQLSSAEIKVVEQLLLKLAQLKVDIGAYEQRTRDVQAQIAKLRPVADEVQKGLTIQLSGETKIRPIYVECHQAGLTIYRPDNQKLNVQEIRFADISNRQEFADLVHEVAEASKSNKEEVLNILLRPAGVKSYDKALEIIFKENAPFASVPVTLKGKIRFIDPATSLPLN